MDQELSLSIQEHQNLIHFRPCYMLLDSCRTRIMRLTEPAQRKLTENIFAQGCSQRWRKWAGLCPTVYSAAAILTSEKRKKRSCPWTNKLFSKDMSNMETDDYKPIPHKQTHPFRPQQCSKIKISRIISHFLLVNTWWVRRNPGQNVPDKPAQAWSLVNEGRPGKKVLFLHFPQSCVQYLAPSGALPWFTICAKSRKCGTKKTDLQESVCQRGRSLQSHYYDGIHTTGAEITNLAVILEKSCSEVYWFKTTSWLRTNRSGAFTDKLDILAPQKGQSNIDS